MNLSRPARARRPFVLSCCLAAALLACPAARAADDEREPIRLSGPIPGGLFAGCSESGSRSLRIVAGDVVIGLAEPGFGFLGETTPMTNLFVSMLERLGVPTDNFGDSTGKVAI